MPNKYLDSVGLAEYTTLIKTALDDKADLDSPALTGTPTAPTPTAGDDSTKVATTAFVNTKAGNYLPLAGGTLTGTLYNSQNDFFTISKTDGVLNQGVRIWGGYGYSGGASLYLYGKNHSSAGDFSLCAHDGTNAKALAGHADGTLTWAGNNVALSKDVLALSGGTMTGNIKFSSGYIGKSTDTTSLSLNGGSDNNNGAYLNLYGKSHSSYAGHFSLTAKDGTNIKQLAGKPDGTLTWDGKNVERVNASGTNYIRYESGLQICWGNCATSTSGTSANTFPVAFSAAPKVVAQEKPGTINHALYMVKLSNVTTTGFQSVVTDGTNYQQWVAEYIAVGRWK